MQAENYGKKAKKTISFEVSDNEDITSCISSLMAVCYYVLDGNGLFVLPGHENHSSTTSVTKVLEMIMDLLPHDQMHCMDRLIEILTSKQK